MFLIKLYDFTLTRLVKALRKSADKSRQLALVSDKVAAEATEAAYDLRQQANQFDLRASRLQDAL